jgi:RNA polymerase sigma factor (sigma-70 family)
VIVTADSSTDDVAAARHVVEHVHSTCSQTLFGFARRLGVSDEEADEIVQEALLRLWRTLARGTRIDDARAWTFTTTYRLVMDRHRVRRRWLTVSARLRPVSTPAPADRDELVALWHEVDLLPPRQRAVLYLHYRADLTFEAIGLVLGIGPSSARANASRGIARLRERLGGEF